MSSSSTSSNCSNQLSRNTNENHLTTEDLKIDIKSGKDLKKLRTIRMLSSPSQSIEVDDNLTIEQCNKDNRTSVVVNENRINFSNKFDDAESDNPLNDEKYGDKKRKDEFFQMKRINLFEKSNLKRSKSLDLSNDRVTLHSTKDKEYDGAKGKLFYSRSFTESNFF